MVKSYFQAYFYDKDHSYLRQSPRYRSRSFVQGFLKLHYPCFTVGSSLSVTDTGGTGRTVSQFLVTMQCTAPGRGGAGMSFTNGGADGGTSTDSVWNSSTNTGIVVGTGTTAVAPTDFQLATQIVDGITSGTLEHFPCAGTNFGTAGTTASFDLERLFRNSSSGTITITEVGLYCAVSGGTSNLHYCIVRDIVSPGFAVLNGEYMRIIYTISVTA